MTELSALPEPLTAARLAILLVLILFLPLSALTYQLFRSHRKKAKIERILDLLKVRGHEQKKYLEIRTGHYLYLCQLCDAGGGARPDHPPVRRTDGI